MSSAQGAAKPWKDSLEITSGHNKVCGMKNLHCFFMCIFILPLTLGIVAVTVVEAYMLRFYFQMIISSLSDQIKVQTATVQNEMLMANKYLFLTGFTEPFSEMFRIRDGLVDFKAQMANTADTNSLFARTKQALKNKTIYCFTSDNIDYQSFPICSDMFLTKDYKTSVEPYKIMIGNVFSIFNGEFNALGSASIKMIDWQTDNIYINDLSALLVLSPMMTAFWENNVQATYRADRFNNSFHEVVTPTGLYGINYFNFDFVNNQDVNTTDCPAEIQSKYTVQTSIKADPRCFKWYSNTLQYYCRYLKKLANQKPASQQSTLKLTPDNMLIPMLLTQNDLKATGDLMRVKITMLTGYDRSDCDADANKTYDASNYLISKDVYFYPVLDMIARAFSKGIAFYLRYSKLSTPQLESYIDMLKNIVSKTPKIDPPDYIGWVRKVEKETKFAIGFYIVYLKPDLTYAVLADMKLDTFFDENFKAPTNNPTNSDKQREEDVKFIKDFVKNNLTFVKDLEAPNSAIDIKSGIYPDYKLFDPESRTFKSKRVNIVTDSVGITERRNGRYIELFKVIYVMPEYLITEKYDLLISNMDSKILMNSIYASVIVLLFLIIGIVVILIFASKVVRHLNETVLVAQQVSKAESVIQDKEDVEKNMNYEIQQTKNALFDLNKVFNSQNNGGGMDEGDLAEDKNVLRYAYKIKLFSMLDDKRMCGVLNNNMGNIHFNAGRYKEASNKYQESIDILDQMYTNTGESDKAITEEEYISLKCDRNMNQCLAVKQQLELEIAKYGVNSIYEKIEGLKKMIGYIKDRIPESAHNKYIKCLCLFAWISRIREEPFNAMNNLNQASDRLQRFKDKIPSNTSFLLGQEIDLERSYLLLKEKKYKKSLALVTDALKRDKNFEMSFRKKYVSLLVEIFKLLNVPPTPGVLELKERFLEKTGTRRYIVALDYSSSMRYGNKITNSIKAILDLWDEYIRPSDKFGLVRFNLNPEVVFGLESKSINTFGKRLEIEKSLYPKDRTCFFDCVLKCCDMFNKDKLGSTNTKDYLIMLCDGDDTSSLKQEKEALASIQLSNCCLITVGLGLKDDPTTRNMLKRASASSSRRGGLYIDILDESFEDLFEVISEYANNLPYSELHWE